MNKLDELIAELCPDGVEYKPLSEIATITRGVIFKRRILLKVVFRVSIMVRYIRNTVCSQIRLLHLSVKQLLLGRRKLSLVIL